jgi:biopolymer transport protein ExbB
MHRHSRLRFRDALAAILLTLGTAVPALAAEEAPSQESYTFLQMIEKSGLSGMLFLGLLGVFSLGTVAIILERLVSLSRRKVIPLPFVAGLKELAGSDDDLGPLRDLCRSYPSPAANVLKAGLLRAGRPVAEVEKAMEDALAREASGLRSRVRPLSVAANVAPLIGLLGTVIGIIMAFQTASRTTKGGDRSEVMAEGISLALLATAAGLAIAIPALLFAAFSHNRVDQRLREMDECLLEVIPWLACREQPVGNRPAAQEEKALVGAGTS